MRQLLVLLAAAAATPSGHRCPIGGASDGLLDSPSARAALDADLSDAAGRVSLIQRASAAARAPALARPPPTKGVAPWARTGLALALLAKSQGVASGPSGASRIPGSVPTPATGANLEANLVPASTIASAPSKTPRITEGFQTPAKGADLEADLVPAIPVASGPAEADQTPGSSEIPAAETDVEAELVPATTAAGSPPNTEDAAEVPDVAQTLELMPGTSWTSGEASEEGARVRKEDAAVLAESATALREGVRRSGQILRENTQIRREDARLRLEEAEIRKEMLQLRHEDSELRRQNSQLRHRVESSLRAETGFHLPGVPPDKTMIATIVLFIVLSGIACYGGTMVYDSMVPDEHTAMPDTDDKTQDLAEVRAQTKKAHHGPEICGFSTGFLRSLVWIWLITAGGFAALWWMGVMQPFLKELLVYVYLITAVCLVAALIIAQASSEFAAVQNAMEMMMKVLRRIDGIMGHVYSDAGKLFDEAWEKHKKDKENLEKMEKDFAAKFNMKGMFGGGAAAPEEAQAAEGGDATATGSKGKGRTKARRAASCCT